MNQVALRVDYKIRVFVVVIEGSTKLQYNHCIMLYAYIDALSNEET